MELSLNQIYLPEFVALSFSWLHVLFKVCFIKFVFTLFAVEDLSTKQSEHQKVI